MRDDDLDRILERVPDPEPSANLLRAVAEIPLRHPHGATVDWRELLPFRSLWRVALSAALVTVLGVATGVLTAAPAAADDEGWDELAALTFGEGFVAEDEETEP